MFKVVIETSKGDIEIWSKPRVEAAEDADRAERSRLMAIPSVLILRVGGTQYEVLQDEFNLAIKPFLDTETSELVW